MQINAHRLHGQDAVVGIEEEERLAGHALVAPELDATILAQEGGCAEGCAQRGFGHADEIRGLSRRWRRRQRDMIGRMCCARTERCEQTKRQSSTDHVFASRATRL